MTKSFALLAAIMAASLTGCAPMCQSPFDYCNAVIGPNGSPNCNYGARYNSSFAPMNGTPATTAIGPTPAAAPSDADSSSTPTDAAPVEPTDQYDLSEPLPQ